MELLNAYDLAEKLRFIGTDKQKRVWMQNLIQSGSLPKEITIKIGKQRLVIAEKLEEFLLKKIKGV